MRLLNDPKLGNFSVTVDKSKDVNLEYYNYLTSIPKRVIANHVGWRILLSSLAFLSDDVDKIALEFKTVAYGQQDVDQRWKTCIQLTANYVSVGTGSLYIAEYFSEDDKKAATQMVDFIFEEYKKTLQSSEWIDADVKQKALAKAKNTLKFIGYHPKLRSRDAFTFYEKLQQWPIDNFFEMAMSLSLFTVDRLFERVVSKTKEPDWTKYSKPQTINAFYSAKDNSIRE